MKNSSLLGHIKQVKKTSYLQAKSMLEKEGSLSNQDQPQIALEKTAKKINNEENKASLEAEVIQEPIRLSEKTAELLQRIKKKNQKSKRSKADVSDIKTVLTEEDSLNPFEEELPEVYKLLVQLLVHTDSLINLYSISEKPKFLKEILNFLQKKFVTKISLEKILQINYLYKFYQFCWVVDPRGNSQELTIDFCKSSSIRTPFLQKSDLNLRKHILVSKLHELFKKITNGKNFKKKANNDSIFVNELRLAEIPSSPNQITGKSLNDVLDEFSNKKDEMYVQKTGTVLNDLKKEGILKELLEKKEKIGQSSTTSQKQKVSDLKEMLLEKIKEKERINEERKRRSVYEAINNGKEELVNLAILLKYHYLSRKVQNMFLVKVVEFLENNYKGMKSFEEINIMINQLVQLCPEWISIIDNASGKILRLNSEVDISTVKEKISLNS